MSDLYLLVILFVYKVEISTGPTNNEIHFLMVDITNCPLALTPTQAPVFSISMYFIVDGHF